GRYAVFSSDAADLVPGDTNGQQDLFVKDLRTGATERVSVASDGTQGDSWSAEPAISADGQYVAFTSAATNLVPGDDNGTADVFVRDRRTGQTERITDDGTGTSTGTGAGPGNATARGSRTPAISADGTGAGAGAGTGGRTGSGARGFRSPAISDDGAGAGTGVGPGNATAPGSRAPTISDDGTGTDTGPGIGAGVGTRSAAPGGSQAPAISAHGTDMGKGTGVGAGTAPGPGRPASGGSRAPAISADGAVVAFVSDRSDLVPGDTNEVQDVFAYDRRTRATRRVSVADGGGQADAAS
ncbi:hypothetical protein ADK38_24285, partial [Streptomyces varsoviensis]